MDKITGKGPIGVVLFLTALLIALAFFAAAGKQINWSIFSFLFVAATLAFLFMFSERTLRSTREITLLATLAAIAAAVRLPFVILPGIQPTTVLIIITGLAMGPWSGFVVGALGGAVSNFALGQGPWTPWQMLAWGLVGAAAGGVRNLSFMHNPVGIAGFGFVFGYLFGWFVNIWVWTSVFYPLSLENFVAVQLTSLGFDTAHALGNFVFGLVLGVPLLKVLQRFQKKLNIYK